MKKSLLCAVSFILVFACVFQTAVFADGVSLLNNNVSEAYIDFDISSDGQAFVSVRYNGYPNVTTDARITIKIEKRNLLIFWKDVVDEIYYIGGNSYSHTYAYQLEKTGTYRCTVEYTISGIGGADDVLTFEDTKTYG
ncbi:MAG: hypothetical protein IJA86_02465 [Clostridia bacterium]|nr:hypothetical protein [Clostridia bacterium]